jgi:hypothetical protein
MNGKWSGNSFLLGFSTKVKPNINSVESSSTNRVINGHPLDGARVGAGSLWSIKGELFM